MCGPSDLLVLALACLGLSLCSIRSWTRLVERPTKSKRHSKILMNATLDESKFNIDGMWWDDFTSSLHNMAVICSESIQIQALKPGEYGPSPSGERWEGRNPMKILWIDVMRSFWALTFHASGSFYVLTELMVIILVCWYLMFFLCQMYIVSIRSYPEFDKSIDVIVSGWICFLPRWFTSKWVMRDGKLEQRT